MPCYLAPPGVRFNDYLFTEPEPLASWRPPGCAGIVAILSRNPQWAPKPLQPLYFGEFGNNAANGVMIARAPENARLEELLVAVLPMPFSTVAQRRSLCRELIAAYNPAMQATGSIASTALLAERVEQLEDRQQEQNQQILSLLSYIGKLFEPQPVAPRRPIGFLPQLAPAGPQATESGSWQ
jgi:hypothetical protein